MLPNGRNAAAWWAIWGVLALATLIGLWRYSSRTSLPADLVSDTDGLRVQHLTEELSTLSAGLPTSGSPRIDSVDGIPVRSDWQLRLVLTGHAPGDRVTVMASWPDGDRDPAAVEMTLIPYAPLPVRLLDHIVLAVVSLAMLGLSLLVLKKGQHPASAALMLLLALMAASLALEETGSRIGPGAGLWLPGVIWAFTYALSGPAMVEFASCYPRRTTFWERLEPVRKAIWVLGGAVGLSMAICVLLLTSGNRELGYRIGFVGQRLLWVLLLGGVLILAISLVVAFRESDDHASRNRIRWILLGVVLGAGPPLVLNYLVRLLGGTKLMPGMLELLFILLVPIALVISVVQHGLLDVQVAVRRGLVYAPASILVYVVFGGAAVVFTYLVLDASLAGSLPPLTIRYALVFALPLLVFHLLYDPLRRKVQGLVDRVFFRSRIDYGALTRQYAEQIEETVSGRTALELLVSTIESVCSPRWVRLTDLTGEWQEIWTAAQPPVEGVVPDATARFGGIDGLRVDVGPKRSGLAWNEHDRVLLDGLARITASALRREVFQRRLLAEEAERERMEAAARLKDSFLSLVSHDLRSPLGAITVGAEAIARRSAEDDDLARTARSIGRSALRLGGMVDRLLHTALAESDLLRAAPVETDLADAVGAVLERFAPIADHAGVRLISEVSAGTRVCADPALLTESLGNLVDNALRHTPEGSEVTISAERTQTGWRIDVCDEGDGIQPEFIAGIFDKKTVTRDSEGRSGFGMGLPLVAELMRLQGGSASLEKTGPDGSIFSLHLTE